MNVPIPTVNQPWTIGWYGPFRVLTYLDEADKEIDIDDRAAELNVEIQMRDTGALDLVANNVKVTLDFDFSDTAPGGRKNILLNGKEKGPLVLEPNAEVDPGNSLRKQVTISTGHFSALPRKKTRSESAKNAERDSTPDSARPGLKEVGVTIEYDLQPREMVAGRRTQQTATMQFYVDKD